jgi:UDP:flavonoid glycosyltransferase YjiC (YdhE family)
MAGGGPKRAARALHDAIAPTGRRCLIGAGWAGLGAGDLPRGWRVAGDVPHAKLFPRVALAIHHGGAGTTANALRAGTRQVLLPLLLDQYHHAHVLYEAQLAPRAVAMERVNGASLATCIDEAMRLPDEPRLAVAQRLKASDGAAQTIELLESKTAP